MCRHGRGRWPPAVLSCFVTLLPLPCNDLALSALRGRPSCGSKRAVWHGRTARLARPNGPFGLTCRLLRSRPGAFVVKTSCCGSLPPPRTAAGAYGRQRAQYIIRCARAGREAGCALAGQWRQAGCDENDYAYIFAIWTLQLEYYCYLCGDKIKTHK